MAAAKGNQYAAKERAWAQAINLALEERGGDLGRMGALKELAEKLLVQCASGDMAALRELGDRLDGKPKQAIVGGDEDDAPLQVETIKRLIVDPRASTD